MEVRFNKNKKQLRVDAKDPAFLTPLKHLVIADVLSSVYEVINLDNQVKFEYFKENGSWGFRAIKKKAL